MAIVDTNGPTRIPCAVVALTPMTHRNFRIEDADWKALSRIAALQGERTSEVMRQLVKGYVAKHRKLLADDPEWQAHLRGDTEG